MTDSYFMSIDVESDTKEIRAVYFQVRPGKSAETKVFQRGDVMADYDSSGQLLGIEMIAPIKASTLKKISRRDSETRSIVTRSMPVEMVAT